MPVIFVFCWCYIEFYCQILDPEEDPEEEEEDGGAQDMDATRRAKSAVMKTSTRQVIDLFRSLAVALFNYSIAVHGSRDLVRRLGRVGVA